MKDLKIIPVEPGHEIASTLVDWIEDEWGEETGQTREEIAERLFAHVDCPPTHAAVEASSGQPLGVITFRRFASPERDEFAVWIDALFVNPEHRNCGIGSRLIQAADDLVRPFENLMYVYTNLPPLYERIGWREVVPANDAGCSKLRKDLESETS